MARKISNTIEFFQHYANKQSRTIAKLESKYGNDGYSFLFRLLEILAATENHYLDLSEPADMDYFAARMRIEPETCEKILNDLVSWKKIDKQLWQDKRGVWYEQFVKNHSHVYEKRKRQLPAKPIISATEIQAEVHSCHRNDTIAAIPVPESTHSIVEYSIAQNSIVEDRIKASLSGSDEPQKEHGFIILFNELTGRKMKGFSDKAKRQLAKLKKKNFTLADFKTAITNGHINSARWDDPALFTPEYITREDKFLLFLNYQNAQPGQPTLTVAKNEPQKDSPEYYEQLRKQYTFSQSA
jgi:hypothetical protein